MDDWGTRRDEIERIRREIEQIEATWGRPARFPDEARRLEETIVDRRIAAAAMQFRLEAARRRVDEVQHGIEVIRAEIIGFERGLEALLRHVLEEVAGWSKPMWSPIPVLGYRFWDVVASGLRGATGYVWDGPALDALCGGVEGTDDGEVPHTDGRCSHPPCGIYVLKEAATLLRFRWSQSLEHDAAYVLGLAALSGKVVEHDNGYRGRHARVVAAALLQRDRVLASADPDWITALFGRPLGAAQAGEAPPRVVAMPAGAEAGAAIIEFFKDAESEEMSRWTSGNRSA